MSEKRRGLGRGLGALIPSGPATPSVETDKNQGEANKAQSTPAKSSARAEASTSSKETASKKPSAATRKTKPTKTATKTPVAEKAQAETKGQSGKKSAASSQASDGGRSNSTKSPAQASESASSTTKSPASRGPATVSHETKGGASPEKSPTQEKPSSDSNGQAKGTKSNARGRRDMAQALRSTTSVRRPVDMFFLPSDAAEKVEVEDAPGASTELNKPAKTSSSSGETSTNESQAGRNDDVSRETSNLSPAAPSTGQAEAESPAKQGGRGAAHAQTDTPSADGATVESKKEPIRVPSAGGADDTATSGVDGAETAADSGVETSSTPSAPGSDDVSRETSPNAANDRDDEDLAMVPGAQFAEVLVKDIHPNRKQPRQVFDEGELAELAFSVKELGVLQPVVVRPSREDEGAKYELVMGERRWRAVQKAGLDSIPAIIRETSDDDLLRDALLENLHRSQLNPLEEAAAYQQLLEEFGATQDELSQRIGRSRPQISNTLRLLRLPPLVQRRVAAGVLSSGHARALLGLTDPAEMERLAQRIVAEGMSVRATEETVALSDGLKRHTTKRKTPTHRHDDRLNYIADAFSDRLDTSVKIQLGARKGKMTIEFASVEDLNRIIDVLDPKMEDRK